MLNSFITIKITNIKSQTKNQTTFQRQNVRKKKKKKGKEKQNEIQADKTDTQRYIGRQRTSNALYEALENIYYIDRKNLC